MAKTGRPRKTNLRPIDDNIENDSIEMDYDDINQSSEQENIPDGMIRVENNIDFFNTQENDPEFSNVVDKNESSIDISNYKQEITKLTEKINSLENENNTLRIENSKLTTELSELKRMFETESELKRMFEIENENKVDQKMLKSIQDENDNLLLKNSELELEISKIRCQLRNAQTIRQPSATQVYSKEQYTPTYGSVINRKNGYQDWN